MNTKNRYQIEMTKAHIASLQNKAARQYGKTWTAETREARDAAQARLSNINAEIKTANQELAALELDANL